MTRVFLGLSGLVWVPYGIFCFLQPSFLDGAAGLAANTPTGTTELRAMYGGLQAGIGVMLLVALRDARFVIPGLAAIAYLTGGLAVARFGGLLLDGSVSTYTIGAIVFEIACCTIAFWLLSQEDAAEAVG